MTVSFVPWAKLVRSGDSGDQAALPLTDHCLDVAAVFHALLRSGSWDRFLTHLAGRPLTAQDLARLDEAAPAGATAGERYPDMSSVRR